MDIETLQERANIIKKIRNFFDSKNYLSVDTPLLSSDLIPESCLEVFETERLFPHGSKEKSKPLWLIPSPEIHMKKIIAQHKTNVYQICKCFRNGESVGHLHNSEFTMLEYYTMNAGYMESLSLTEDLFKIFEKTRCTGRETSAASAPFNRITVADAFEKFAGFDLFTAAEQPGEMEKQARRLGLEPASGLEVPVLYDLIFIHAVEPHLKTERPIALLDYPAFVPCLAKKAQDGKTVERWELYWNGIELANCFSEETDPQNVKEFFTSEQEKRSKTALVQHSIDTDYWKIFEDFPKCSGVAMGLDRLIMALLGKGDIGGVLI